MGLALKQKDDFAAAERELRKAVELDRALPEPPYTLAVALWQTGRAPEAVPFLREAIARKADYADAHYLLGTLLRQQGQADEALSEFRETIRHQPAAAEAWLSLGQILQQRKEAEGAARAFAEADRLNKRKAEVQASRVALTAGLKKLAENDAPGALAQFQEAVRLDPGNARAHDQLGRVLKARGQAAEGDRHLAEARRLAPYLAPSAGAAAP